MNQCSIDEAEDESNRDIQFLSGSTTSVISASRERKHFPSSSIGGTTSTVSGSNLSLNNASTTRIFASPSTAPAAPVAASRSPLTDGHQDSQSVSASPHQNADGVEYTGRSSTPPGAAKKLRRITRACDYCHKRSIRCRYPGDTEATRCQNCIDFDQPCRFDRVVRRRGAKPRNSIADGEVNENSTIDTSNTTRQAYHAHSQDIHRLSAAEALIPSDAVTRGQWQPAEIVPAQLVFELVNIYFEIVHPVFPIFHESTLLQKLRLGRHRKDRFLFAAIMAICALTTARIQDGALEAQQHLSHDWDMNGISLINPRDLYVAAVCECDHVVSYSRPPLDLLRTLAVLTLTAIQYRDRRETHIWLGKYHVLLSMHGLNDEKNWPVIGFVEREERRRLFWAMYHVDVFVSVLHNSVLQSREQQSHVAYPAEIDDKDLDEQANDNDMISPASITSRSPNPSSSSGQPQNQPVGSRQQANVAKDNPSFLVGFNFITDLFRTLEHLISSFPPHPPEQNGNMNLGRSLDVCCGRRRNSLLDSVFSPPSAVPPHSIRDAIMQMYVSLPQAFKETHMSSGGASLDKLTLQATSIAAVVQLVRIKLFSAGNAPLSEQCHIVLEVVDTFSHVPLTCSKAMSMPLFETLAAIGSTLQGTLDRLTTEDNIIEMHRVVASLAALIETLEANASASGPQRSLRVASTIQALVMKIEQKIQLFGASAAIKQEHRILQGSPMVDAARVMNYTYPIAPTHIDNLAIRSSNTNTMPNHVGTHLILPSNPLGVPIRDGNTSDQARFVQQHQIYPMPTTFPYSSSISSQTLPAASSTHRMHDLYTHQEVLAHQTQFTPGQLYRAASLPNNPSAQGSVPWTWTGDYAPFAEDS